MEGGDPALAVTEVESAVRQAYRKLGLNPGSKRKGHPKFEEELVLRWSAAISDVCNEVWEMEKGERIDSRLPGIVDKFGADLWTGQRRSYAWDSLESKYRPTPSLRYPEDRPRLLELHRDVLRHRVKEKKDYERKKQREVQPAKGKLRKRTRGPRVDKGKLDWFRCLVITRLPSGEDLRIPRRGNPSGKRSSGRKRAAAVTNTASIRSSPLRPANAPPVETAVQDETERRLDDFERALTEPDDEADATYMPSPRAEAELLEEQNFRREDREASLFSTNGDDWRGRDFERQSRGQDPLRHRPMRSAKDTDVKNEAPDIMDRGLGSNPMSPPRSDFLHRSDAIVTRQLGNTVLVTRVVGDIEVDIKLRDCFTHGDSFEFALSACRSDGSHPRRAHPWLSVRLAMSLSSEPYLHIKQGDANTWRTFVNTIQGALERRVDFDENYTLRIPAKITMVPLVED